MTNQDKEVERLRRLRERQIQSRDPLKKKRKLQSQISQKNKARKHYSLADGVNDLSYQVKGLFIGFILGLIAAIGLWAFVDATWVDWAALGAIFFLTILGFIFGASFDWRADLRDF